MQRENPTWSAQRIEGELAKLGYSVCDNTVAKYMRKPKTDGDVPTVVGGLMAAPSVDSLRYLFMFGNA